MAANLPDTALFKPNRSKSESKADATTNAARNILDAETARREAKTAKLRAARLEMEEKQADIDAAAPPKPTKAAKVAKATKVVKAKAAPKAKAAKAPKAG